MFDTSSLINAKKRLIEFSKDTFIAQLSEKEEVEYLTSVSSEMQLYMDMGDELNECN